MSNNAIFKLVSFSPVGFKKINYPIQFCQLCKGSLTEVCGTCFENENDCCEVINVEDTYLHDHCYKIKCQSLKQTL